MGALLVAGALSACGGSRFVDSRSTSYTPGTPDFDLDAFPAVSTDSSAVVALVSIPRVSLVFLRDSSGFRALSRLSLTLRTPEGEILSAPTRVDTVRAMAFEETLSFRPLVLRQPVPAPPGTYRLDAEVEDGVTGQRALRSVAVHVPGPAEEPSVGPARLEGVPRTGEAFRPLVALSVPPDLDSLRVRYEVFGAPGPIDVEARLLKLAADTSVAMPPSAFAPSRGSLVARGVDPDRPDTVFVSRQRVVAPDVSLTLERALPALAPGVYQLRLAATLAENEEPFGETRRTFVVRESGFPRLVGLADLVGPLQYLATPREMAEIREAPPDSIRDAFDAFWGSLFQDRRIAVATFRAFYERVEEANRLFSTYKAGWKTDRGMVYILFGPPERTENRFETEVWIYGPGQSLGTAIYERTSRRDRASLPFDVYTLQRDRAYDGAWRRALRQWRGGQPP